MNNKVDYAIECFNNGFACSQAVLTAFCEDFGMDIKQGLKIASSFGGGMGHMGEACGAVTGALMVLGLKYGQIEEFDRYTKARNYLIVNDFASRFRKIYGSINCIELVGYNLKDEAQLKAARQADIWNIKCVKYIETSVKLLEEILEENDINIEKS